MMLRCSLLLISHGFTFAEFGLKPRGSICNLTKLVAKTFGGNEDKKSPSKAGSINGMLS